MEKLQNEGLSHIEIFVMRSSLMTANRGGTKIAYQYSKNRLKIVERR